MLEKAEDKKESVTTHWIMLEEAETTFHYFIGKGGSHNLVATLT